MNRQFSIKSRMFGTSCVLALTVAGGMAPAQEIDIEDGVYVIGVNQTFNGFQNNTASITSITGGDVLEREVEVGFTVNDEVAESNLTVGGTEGNVASASLTVNLAETALESDVNNDTFETEGATASAGTFFDGRDRAEAGAEDADLSISTAQNVNDADADVQSASKIGTFSTDVIFSTITVSNNVQEGVGLLNRNTTTLTSSANASDASTSIATSQNVTESSLDVTTSSLADVEVGGAGSDSTLELTGNTQRAVAAGNVGVNTIDSDANDLEIIASGPFSTTIDLTNPAAPSSKATAGNVIASSQVMNLLDSDPITATVDGDGAGFEASVTEGVSDATIVNESNLASALIIGNEVANEISLSGNSIETGTIFPADGFVAVPGAAAALSSMQVFEGKATATALAEAEQGVRTLIGNDVDDSSISTSKNGIKATAIGNTGANRVIADDTNFIDTSAEGQGPGATANALTGLVDTVTTTGAGFELSSAQTADGSITATLTDDSADPITAASIATDIGGDITMSTVQSDDNTLQARAIGNEIIEQTNEILVSGTNVATTTALANFQGLEADVSAVVGSPGIPGTPPETFTLAGGIEVAGGSTEAVSMQGFSQQAAQEFANQLAASGLDVSFDSNNNVLELTNPNTSGTIITDPETVTFAGSPAVPGAGGVTVASGATITDSTITVDSNTTRGTVTGNVATNSIEVSATNLDSGSTLTSSTAAGDTVPNTTSTIGVAGAENALANTQTIDGSELSTDVAGTFAVVSNLNDYDTTSSTLSVSDNEQFATTRGNEVANSVDLSATNMETGAAISSLQIGGGVTVTADSVMDVYAPAAMSGSTLALNGNRNEAEATINTADNTLDVTPTNITSISGGTNVDLLSSLTSDSGNFLIENLAVADFALANSQAASGTVSADATSRVVNQDMSGDDTPFATTGIENSSVTVDGNVTLAIGSANHAINNMMLDAGASSAATGAVLNLQTSSSSVTANVDATTGIDLLSDGTASALDASSASVSNNTASAQARGNVSSNVLNASAVSLGGVGSGPASVNLQTGNLADGGVSASFGVLNNQVNSGSIGATVTAQYGANLGNQDGSAIQGSQSSVSGNVIQAAAAANTATNNLTLSALNHASSGAIGNEQINSGNVAAQVSGSRIGVSTNGSVQSSTMSARGNSISSSAIGNRAVSTISRN